MNTEMKKMQMPNSYKEFSMFSKACQNNIKNCTSGKKEEKVNNMLMTLQDQFGDSFFRYTTKTTKTTNDTG